MKDLQAFMHHSDGLQRPFSDAEDNRIWLLDPRPDQRANSATPGTDHLSALFELVEGGERREFVADSTRLGSDSRVHYITGLHHTAAPHQAYEESVGIAFLSDLPNGYYPVDNGSIAFNYQLYFRSPPCCPGENIAVSFEILSGMLLLQNDWEQGQVAGTLRDVLVRIHKVDHEIGVGPDRDYEMKMLNGRFSVRL